jgi:type IV pilus assembly protein PilM
MVRWFSKPCGPIGIDLGSRSVKLVQFDAEYKRLVEAVRWDLPLQAGDDDDDKHYHRLTEALGEARAGRDFRGRTAIVCLSAPQLFIQNIRIPKVPREELDRLVFQEAAGRIPFPIEQAEIRYLEAADVRQGEALRRELILLAVHRPVLQKQLDVIVKAGLRPVAVDIEPAALLRCYVKQFRRDEDRQQRAMFVHVGASRTAVVIAQGADILFIKYIEVGGRQMDEAVTNNLKVDLADASALRRHNGDRRADQQDPEVARSIGESVRPVIDQLAGELSMCVRYHSVTFRGRPLARVVLGGGEASPTLAQALGERLDMKCELGDPLRTYQPTVPAGRTGQWDVATGLALRQAN